MVFHVSDHFISTTTAKLCMHLALRHLPSFVCERSKGNHMQLCVTSPSVDFSQVVFSTEFGAASPQLVFLFKKLDFVIHINHLRERPGQQNMEKPCTCAAIRGIFLFFFHQSVGFFPMLFFSIEFGKAMCWCSHAWQLVFQ